MDDDCEGRLTMSDERKQERRALDRELGAGTRNTDGEFTVCILHNRSRIQLLRILLTAFFRNPAGFAGVRSYGCRELRVSLEEPVPMHTDGEDCGEHSELHLRCVRRKLKILC